MEKSRIFLEGAETCFNSAFLEQLSSTAALAYYFFGIFEMALYGDKNIRHYSTPNEGVYVFSTWGLLERARLVFVGH